MTKPVIASLALSLVTALSVAPASAQEASAAASSNIPAAAPGRYNVQEATLGDLLDDPAAKGVLDKNLPGLSSESQIDMARGLTLVAMQGFAPDRISPEALAAVQAGLNALPPKK